MLRQNTMVFECLKVVAECSGCSNMSAQNKANTIKLTSTAVHTSNTGHVMDR